MCVNLIFQKFMTSNTLHTAKYMNTGAKILCSALRARNTKHNQCSKKEAEKQRIIVDVDTYEVNKASKPDEDWWIEELNLPWQLYV